MATDSTAIFTGAIVGVCIAIGICVIALIIFVIVFCRVQIENDTNIRKRLIRNSAFDEERIIDEQPRPRPVFVEPEPLPLPMPQPQPVFYPPPEPVMLPRPVPQPMPQTRIIERQTPPPQPPPQPVEPRVIIREVVRERTPTPPPPPQPVQQTRVVRRNSWGGTVNSDWVLVKKITKRRNGKRNDSESSSSSSSSSSDDEDDRRQRHVYQKPPRRAPLRVAYPRLAAYDLAAPNVVYGNRPAPMFGMVQQPQQTYMAQAVMAPTQQTYAMAPTMMAPVAGGAGPNVIFMQPTL